MKTPILKLARFDRVEKTQGCVKQGDQMKLRRMHSIYLAILNPLAFPRTHHCQGETSLSPSPFETSAELPLVLPSSTYLTTFRSFSRADLRLGPNC